MPTCRSAWLHGWRPAADLPQRSPRSQRRSSQRLEQLWSGHPSREKSKAHSRSCLPVPQIQQQILGALGVLGGEEPHRCTLLPCPLTAPEICLMGAARGLQSTIWSRTPTAAPAAIPGLPATEWLFRTKPATSSPVSASILATRPI